MNGDHAPAGGGRVCVVGSLNIDTTYRVPVLPGLGETVLATGRSCSPGGKGANQAVAAATVGSRVRFVGAVGADENAELGLAALAERGIDTSGVRRLVQLEVPVPALLAVAEAGPALLVLNPAPVLDPAGLAPLLPHVDVLVPNRAELGQLAGRPVPTTLEEVAACAAALDFDGKLVVTLGRDGAAILEPGGWVVEHVAAPVVEAADTSGAGDAFCGVLVHELARRGDDLAAAVRRAVALASTSTLYPGAQVPPTFGHEES